MDYQLAKKIKSFNSAKKRDDETAEERKTAASLEFGWDFLEDHCDKCKNYDSYNAALEMTEEEQIDYFERQVAGMPEFEEWLSRSKIWLF